MRKRNGTFEGVDGVAIATATWRPKRGMPRAVVVIAHGFNSHSGYYAWTAERLVAHGFAVYALDHRGRGRSEGERFFVNRFSDYVEDLATFIRIAKEREPGLPVFLLGHSAGGVIACSYALDHRGEIDGLICESFAFRVYAPSLALTALKGLSRVAPHAHVLRLPNAGFSHDPDVVDELDGDPLIAQEVQPSRTVAEMVRADERLQREFAQITLPLLILHGTADRVTRPEGSQLFYDAAGSKDKTLRFYPGVAHDPLNDFGKETVLADIESWIDARLPAPQGASRSIVHPTPARR